MSYKVKSPGAPYWTGTGSQAGTIPTGTILDLDSAPRTIKERTTYKIILQLAYQGKYIELQYLEAYTPADPEPDPTIQLTHTIEVYSDGSISIDGIPYP